jgi:hypothetical protein
MCVNHLLKTCVLFLLLACGCLSAKAQSCQLNDYGMLYSTPILWNTSAGDDPAARISFNNASGTITAYPGVQNARAVAPLQTSPLTGLLWEFYVGQNRPPERFGFVPSPCPYGDERQCMSEYWYAASDSGTGRWRMGVACQTDVGCPVVEVQSGDFLAIEWTSNNLIRYYQNRQLIFSRQGGPPSLVIVANQSYRIGAYFNPASVFLSAFNAQEKAFSCQ